MATYQDDFFTRGPTPLARLTFFALLAVAVMIADHRFQALGTVRGGISSVLTPIEHALTWPAQMLRSTSVYFTDQARLVEENKALYEKNLALATEGQRAKLIAAEQTNVAALQSANNRLTNDGVIAEIIRDARNPFSRKIVINRGLSHAIQQGAAVIDGKGVVGQVTSIGVASAEVTLLTEKDQSVPVLVLRNGRRALAVGTGRDGTIELPFIPVAADIQVGDSLVTSGIDGTYPAGLAVATVTIVDKNPAFSFARIVAQPTTAPDHYRFVKVLQPPRPSDNATTTANNNAYPGIDVTTSDKSGADKAEKGDKAAKSAKAAKRNSQQSQSNPPESKRPSRTKEP